MRTVPASLLLALVVLSCRPSPPPEASAAFDYLTESGLVSVLVEKARLAPPPALASNRLAAGWRPTGGSGLAPFGPQSTVEFVDLVARPRQLHLRLAEEPEGAGSVAVFEAGTRQAVVDWSREMTLPLAPTAAPQSRFVRMEFSSPAPVVAEVRVTPSLPAGEATIEGRSIRQSPSSAIEILHRVPSPGTLQITFDPPPAPRPGQVFEAWLEDADGRRRLARLEPDEPREIVADLGAGSFAVTLLALGEGEPCRWIEPRWRATEPPVGATRNDDESLAASADAASPDAASPDAASPASRPKLVVVYVLDALRADALQQLEAGGREPFISRLGREGRVFTNHRSVAPNTLPATASLFYGRLFDMTLTPRHVDVPHLESLAETFRRTGYRTALFSSNIYVTEKFFMDRGFDYVAPRVDASATADNLASEAVTAAVLDWLATQDPKADLFLYLHVINPHNPYTPPPAYRSHPESAATTPMLVNIREGRWRPDSEQIEHIRRAYLDSVAYADSVLESFVDQLSQRYEAGEMALVVSSDHGEELLEHGGILHGHSLYEEALEIPLVLWPAERFGRGPVERATTTLDTHRLLEALAEGRSTELTAPAFELEDLVISSASSVPRGVLGVQRGRWKVVLTGTRRAEWGMGYGVARTFDTEYLLDLASGEDENRLGRGDLEARWLRAFARRLASTHGPAGDLFTDFDAETTEQLQSLGYL